MNSLDVDTFSVVLSFLTIEDILSISFLSKKYNSYIQKFLDFINDNLICKSCYSNYISFVTGYTFITYIEKDAHGDQFLPPILTFKCIDCLGKEYFYYLKNNSIEYTYKINNSDSEYENLLIYEFTNFTKYSSSHYCCFCEELVSKNNKLVAVLENERQFKYQDTYHLYCFMKKFIATKSSLDCSLKEVKNMLIIS
jgi:hypothetical protein